MARIKQVKSDHLLVGYRPQPGAPEKTWRCPDEETFNKFNEVEQACKAAGLDVPDPATSFRAVPRSKGKRARQREERERQQAIAQQSAAEQKPRSTLTVREFVGRPSIDEPGLFFRLTDRMSPDHMTTYERLLAKRCGHFADKPMDEVTNDDSRQVLNEAITCKSCLERALAAGRFDLVENAADQLTIDREPWEEREGGASLCVDKDGESTHYTNKADTIINWLGLLRKVWNTAIDASRLGEYPELDSVTKNPFALLPKAVPQIPEKVTNDDLSQALTHWEIDAIRLALTPSLRTLLLVATYALLRKSESLGIEIGDIDFLDEPKFEGCARLTIHHVYIKRRGKLIRRPWGKTRKSAREPIIVQPDVAQALRDHIAQYRSTPNPDVCEACANGERDHLNRRTNPHRGCDFANDAPLWIDPDNGARLTPDAWSERHFADAVAATGLSDALGFKATPKLLRATGATMRLDEGFPADQVMKEGRWSSKQTMLDSYYRTRDVRRIRDAVHMARARSCALGLVVEENDLEASVRYQAEQVDYLTYKIAAYEKALRSMGVDPDTAFSTPPRTKKMRRAVSPLQDIELVREVAANSVNVSEMCRTMQLHTKFAPDLRRVAAEHGIDLPNGRLTMEQVDQRLKEIFADVDHVRRVVTGSKSKWATLRALGVPQNGRTESALQGFCEQHDIPLPWSTGEEAA